MGRKIPSKKHRGVKDPLEQQARRLQSLKSKINAPPTDPDEQPVPRSLTRLFATEAVRQEKRAKKVRKQPLKGNVGSSSNGNPLGRMSRGAGESARAFSLRINSAVRSLQKDHDDDAHYPDNFDEEDSKGAAMAEWKARRRQRRGATAGKVDKEVIRGGSAQRRAERKRAAREQREQERQQGAREAVQHEHVPFGAVVHAPPQLPALRGQPSQLAQRPGRRQLLLTAMLAGGGNGEAGRARSLPVPPAEAARRERARLDAVAAYRQLKATRKTREVIS